MAPETLIRPLDEAVVGRRSRELVGAGMDAVTAAWVSRDPGYDLHELLELLGRGCPAHLAVRILAPLPRRPASWT